MWKKAVTRIFLCAAVLSLLLCAVAPFLYFSGRINEAGYKALFLAASLGWFVFSVIWLSLRKKKTSMKD